MLFQNHDLSLVNLAYIISWCQNHDLISWLKMVSNRPCYRSSSSLDFFLSLHTCLSITCGEGKMLNLFTTHLFLFFLTGHQSIYPLLVVTSFLCIFLLCFLYVLLLLNKGDFLTWVSKMKRKTKRRWFQGFLIGYVLKWGIRTFNRNCRWSGRGWCDG